MNCGGAANNKRKKLVVVGDGGCGKTSLLVTYSTGRFPEAYVPTVFDNYVTTVAVAGGRRVPLTLWDTAGQEDFDRLRLLSYEGADVVLVCFALDRATSLANVRQLWHGEVRAHLPRVPLVLVGCKADRRRDGRRGSDPEFDPVEHQAAVDVAVEIGAAAYIECSAREARGLADVFATAATAALLGPAGGPAGSCVIL